MRKVAVYKVAKYANEGPGGSRRSMGMFKEIMKIAKMYDFKMEICEKINDAMLGEFGVVLISCIHDHCRPDVVVSIWEVNGYENAADFNVSREACTIKSVGDYSDKIDKMRETLEKLLAELDEKES